MRHAQTRPGIDDGADWRPQTGAGSSLHHLAPSLPCAEQAAVMGWYDRIGQPCKVGHSGWIGGRGVFTTDPAGKGVGLVAYDAGELRP